MENYQIKIKQYESEALLEFKSGNIDKAVLLLASAWEELPEPKSEKAESYLIARSLIFALNKIKKHEQALDWAKQIMICSLDRYDSGDREFMAGTVLYHLGRTDDAWQYFDVANDKSEGRCFLSSDKEYLTFFKTNPFYHITMFPEPVAVFADAVEQHAKFLFPLFSINLNLINPLWDGKLHMLQFNEDPYNPVGAKTFNEYCTDCMIAFDVIDGKYSFKTDFDYFSLTKDWIQWFEKTKEGYNAVKKNYQATGYLSKPGRSSGVFEQIGGEPEWMQYDETPVDPEGNPMTFICRVYTSNYMDDSCSKDLYLFYSHNCKLAVLLYQIT